MSVWGSPKAGAEEPLSRLNRADHTATAVVDTEQARSHLSLPAEAENRATAEAAPPSRTDTRTMMTVHPKPQCSVALLMDGRAPRNSPRRS